MSLRDQSSNPSLPVSFLQYVQSNCQMDIGIWRVSLVCSLSLPQYEARIWGGGLENVLRWGGIFVCFMGFPCLNISNCFFELMQLLAATCFREFHSLTSLFLASSCFKMATCLFVLMRNNYSTGKAGNICWLFIFSVTAHITLDFIGVHHTLFSHPTARLSTNLFSCSSFRCHPSVMALPSIFTRVTIRWPELHTIFKMQALYPSCHSNAFHFILYFFPQNS